MLRVDFHCHTIHSRDSLARLEKIIHVCRQRGVDRVIITDHNTIAGARQALELDPERVIIGEEIETTRGEILAAYVRESIPPGLPPHETIARLRDQGAFISVSHPFDVLRSGGWAMNDLMAIIPLVDAIEIYNARCMWPGFNDQAQKFARRYDLPGTVGSDAHVPAEIGRAVALLPDFEGPDELRAVIKQARYELRWTPWWVHFTSRFAKWMKAITSLTCGQ